MKTTNKHYEAPKAEIIEIGPLSVLCASAGGDTSTSPGGNGFHFGTSNGQW